MFLRVYVCVCDCVVVVVVVVVLLGKPRKRELIDRCADMEMNMTTRARTWKHGYIGYGLVYSGLGKQTNKQTKNLVLAFNSDL